MFLAFNFCTKLIDDHFHCTLYLAGSSFLQLSFIRFALMLFWSLNALLSPEKRSPTMHIPLDFQSRFLSVNKAPPNSPLFFLNGELSLDLENVFCSKTRMKILKLLFKLGQLNTSDLAHRLGTNYETTLRHLTLLLKEEIIKQRTSGKARFFRLSNTLKARAVIKLLEQWEQ